MLHETKICRRLRSEDSRRRRTLTAKEKIYGQKIVCLIAVLCMALGFTACSGNTLANGDKGTDMKGGFVASTNGYVYFINGVESYTTTYKTGKVTKGALMRVKKTNLRQVTPHMKRSFPNLSFPTIKPRVSTSTENTFITPFRPPRTTKRRNEERPASFLQNETRRFRNFRKNRG